MKSFKWRKISFALLFALMFSTVSACSDVSTQSKPADQKAVTTTSVKSDNTQDSSKSSNSNPKSTANSSSAQKSTSPTNATTDTAQTQYKALANLEFKGTQVIELNHNHVTFSKNDLSLSKGSWQSYSNLDSLNRVGTANAIISKSLMPTEEREPLHVDPTGWKNKKVLVNGKAEWLYNRCHLIGFQLTGQNNNIKNLMTGTRSLNDPDMLVYENKVASYIKTTNHHVRYQVEPVFRGNELVARGVHMQGKSIEDQTIEFNVYIFNVEPGVTIDYADGSSTVQSAAATTNNHTAATANQTTSSPTTTTSISASTLTVNPGDKATVTVKTKPNVQGTIEVDYASGPSHAEGLEPQTSNSNGNISWTWEVGTRTKPGTYNVIINVNGQTIEKQLIVK